MNEILLFSASVSVMVLFIFTILHFIAKPTPHDTKRPTHKFSKRAEWLNQARVNLTVHQFWISSAGCALLTFLAVSLISKTPLIAIVVAAGSAYIPFMAISKKRSDIAKELLNAWPDALRDISATISAGHSLSFALRTLGQVGPGPIAPHMARFSILENSMGLRAALEIIREEMSDATTDRIIEVLIVAHERGGKVVKEIIDGLIESTTEDIALAETIATENIEMKINSRAVVIIPWCVLILLTLSGGIFREFYSTKAGAVVIAIGTVMSIGGIYILSKLTKVDLEPRVFVSEVSP